MSETLVDAVIVGAGFSGLYATHHLRNLRGLSVQCFEAASGPGGVWWWNRYPGARCDFESIFYSFSFDEDLQREWRWRERYASQPEILAYLEHVADRFDLRRSYRFNTRVTSAAWDDDAAHWVVATDDGAVTTARFFINAAGAFSVFKKNDFPGQDDFRGTVLHTSRWPADGVDLAGKRVAVIGTGSTGIQVIQTIAEQVAELTVFQRTANFACPLGNRPLTDEEFAQAVAEYPRLREESRNSLAGAAYPRAVRPALMDAPEERRKVYDQYYNGGGFRMLASTYFDLIFNPLANETAAEYIRDRIRERVQDPKVAELLCPTDHPYGAKRATFETKYYETFNLPHVRLVDARTTPIVQITETGIATTAQQYEFDVIVLATGFDVGGAGLIRMGVVGRGGRRLTDHWAHGQRAYLGMATRGFPNLFHINGPQSAAALFNNPIAIEDSVDFVASLIAYADAHGHATTEVTAAAEDRYNDLVREVAEVTLFPKATTWYMGDNIPGKPRTPLSLFTGAPMYRAICAEVEATGYAGFSFDESDQALPATIKLDGAAVFFLAGMLNMGAKPLEQCSLEEARAAMESFRLMQRPVPPTSASPKRSTRSRAVSGRSACTGRRPPASCRSWSSSTAAAGSAAAWTRSTSPAQPSPSAWAPSSYPRTTGSPRSTRSRPPPTTRWRCCAGPRTRSPNSAVTPSGSRSAGRAPARISPPSPPCVSATRAARACARRSLSLRRPILWRTTSPAGPLPGGRSSRPNSAREWWHCISATLPTPRRRGLLRRGRLTCQGYLQPW